MKRAPAPAAPIRIQVAFAAPGCESIVDLALPPDATAELAVERSGLLVRHGLDAATVVCSIFGQRAAGDTPLADGDRVELTRSLVADPKAVRRERARRRM